MNKHLRRSLRWRGEWWFVLLSALALVSEAFAGAALTPASAVFGERPLDFAAVLLALLGLLALRPARR